MDTQNSIRCVRAPRDSQHPYFMTARAVAQDMALSLDERGLLWYILSLPDDWVAHPMQLGKANGVKSKDKIYNLFKSLMKAGYCERKNLRKDGKHEATIYFFYEEKQQRLIDLYNKPDNEDSRFLKNRKLEKQDPEFQDPVKQDTTDNTSSTEKKKKKRNASLPSIEFDYEINQFANIQPSDMEDWTQLYAGVNIDLELGKMRQWLMDPKNPERDGNRTFITNWLSRAQKEGAKTPRKPAAPAPTEPTLTPNANGSIIPYNSSIAYSILHDDGVDAYVNYLKTISDQKYYKNYLNGKYERNYVDYLEEQRTE